MQGMLGVMLSLSESPKPTILHLVTLKEKEHGHLCLTPLGPAPPVILEPVPRRKHHNHHVSERPRNVVLTTITISAEFDSLIVMLFLTLVRFHEIKVHRQKGICDSFVFIVHVMKI